MQQTKNKIENKKVKGRKRGNELNNVHECDLFIRSQYGTTHFLYIFIYLYEFLDIFFSKYKKRKEKNIEITPA